jgi:aconitase A
MNAKQYIEVLTKNDIVSLTSESHINVVSNLVEATIRKKTPAELVDIFGDEITKKNAEAGYSLLSVFVNFIETDTQVPANLLEYIAKSLRLHIDEGVELKDALNLAGSKVNNDKREAKISDMVDVKSRSWEKEHGYKLPLENRSSKHKTSIYELVANDLVDEGRSVTWESVKKHHENHRSFNNKFDKHIESIQEERDDFLP